MRIGRPRLAQRVREALRSGSAVLTAPAGYGKTALLEEALASWAPPPVWLRGTPADRDPRALAARLIAAVGDAAPGAARCLAPLRGAARRGADPLGVTAALTAELDRLCSAPLAIVVDDAQHLARGAGGGVVGALLRRPSAAFRVVVSSRRPLDLPLAKLRAAGRLAELGAGDLAFTAGELAELAAAAWGVAPDAGEVDELLLATEGWPLGVAALMARVGVGAGEGRPAALRRALAETVLAPLDSATHGHVLASAVPPRLSPRIAAALGLPEGFLADAVARGVPLRPEAPGDDRCAYDPVFREVLLERLAADSGAGLVADLRRRAAPALAAEGLLAEAVETWAGAGDWAQVEAALAGAGWTLATRAPQRVEAWIESMPPARRSAPAVAAVRGQLERRAGNHDAAIALLQPAVASGRLASDVAAWARLALADALVAAGDLTAAVGVAREAGGSGGGGGRPPPTDAAAPRAWLEVLTQGFSDLPAGRLVRAEQAAAAALLELERDDPLGLRFGVMGLLALTLAEQGRAEDALAWWRRIGTEAAESHLTGKAAGARAFEALLLAQLGRLGEAESALVAHAPAPAWTAYPRHAARALVDAGQGRAAEAVESAERALGAARAAPPAFRAWAAADVAPALATAGDAARAADVVAGATRLVDRAFPGARGRLLRARTRALRAWLAAGQAEDEAAAGDIRRVLDGAGDAGAYALRREWPRLAPVVSRALELGLLDGPATMARLSDAFPDGVALVPFTEHPCAAVRLAALGPALASGHPAVPHRAKRFCRDPDPSVSAAAQAALARAGTDPLPRVFRTLGRFEVRRGAFRIADGAWSRPVDARLMRFLLIREGVPAPEDVLFDALWPELSPAGARRSLQVAASRVRALLDHPGTPVSILEVAHGAYRLHRAPADVVDWEGFEAAAAAALSSPYPSRPALEHARRLWGGPPLPEERRSDWASAWRERLNERYLGVLAALVDHGRREGDHGAAIEAAQEMVGFDPLNEEAHRQLMAAYARAGQRSRALHQFLACRRTLVAELGIEPAEPTIRLYATILDGGRPW